jgi:uncharacterized protein (TIGR03435 family)
MRAVMLAFAAAAIVALSAQQQPEPRFDVVSIKPNASGEQGGRNAIEPGAYRGVNVTVRRMIALAYMPWPDAQIVGGPGWINSDRFDVRGTFTGTRTTPQVQQMMRAMLADRFGLRTHTESRPTAVFVLTVARAGVLGPSLTQADIDCGNPADRAKRQAEVAAGGGGVRCGFQYTDGLIRGGGVTLDQVAGEIASGRTVVNRTGLAGTFNVELRWTPDSTAAPADTAPPPLATALREQLGLNLESATMPMEFLVIDAAGRPQAN